MIQDFDLYFTQQKVIHPKKIHYYVKWVQQLYQYYDQPAGSDPDRSG